MLSCLLAAHALAAPITDPVKYVNVLQGTRSVMDFSNGNTLPLVGRPWGMNTWSVMTDVQNEPNGFWFDSGHTKLYGVKCTHQPSPWMNDYGHFHVMTSVGPALKDTNNMEYSIFNPNKDSTWRPDLISTKQWQMVGQGGQPAAKNVYAPRISVTSTERAAIINTAFGPQDTRVLMDQTRYFYLTMPLPSDSVTVAGNVLTGYTTKSTSCGTSFFGDQCPTFKMYVYGNFSCAPTKVTQVSKNKIQVAFDTTCTSLDFSVATSYISIPMAQEALKREVGAKNFDQLLAESTDLWNEHLGRYQIDDAGDEVDSVGVLYSCLYRASMFPRKMYEIDTTGKEVHYSPYTPTPEKGQVFDGVLSTDHGFWDAYRTVYPLLTLLYADKLGVLIQGYVESYKEGGWLPKWASPGYRGTMVGTMGDIVVADAIVNEIPGVDYATAYEAIRKDAYEEVQLNDPVQRGRNGLKEFLKYKFVPAGGITWSCACCCNNVARTQEYAFCDYTISRAAEKLGKTSDAADLLARSKYYKNIFNNKTGFPSPKNMDGSWNTEFDEYAWNDAYVEGGPWQFKLQSVFDVEGMQQLFGGPAELVKQVKAVVETPPIYHATSPSHEQREMAVLDFGQYAHNNQPVHHVLYIAGVSGDLSTTQGYVRQVMSQLYSIDTFSGDEDNGEMGAWYVLSSLGLYNLVPASGKWVFGSPLFKAVTLKLGNGKNLSINAPLNSKTAVYSSSISFNGKPVNGTDIDYTALMAGGTLSFAMTEQKQ